MRYLVYFSYVVLVVAVCYFGGIEYYSHKKNVTQQYELYQKPMGPIPVADIRSNQLQQSVGAGSYYVLDVDSGVALAQKNSETLFFPASTAKMMTALVARDIFTLDTIVPITTGTIGIGEKTTFFVGSQFTVKDILTATLVQSNNAAALNLAKADPLGQVYFIERMNQKALNLHMNSTRFDNPVGFDSEFMQTTAKDLALLAQELTKDPVLLSIVGTRQATIQDVVNAKVYTLHNTNALLGYNNQIIGMKTGTTDLAGQVLVSLADIEGHLVVIVVLDSFDRYTDTKNILDWLNTQVEWYQSEELQ